MYYLYCPSTLPLPSPAVPLPDLLLQVVAGSKTFTLLPPADIFRMRLRQYASATYQPQGGPEADSQVSGHWPLAIGHWSLVSGRWMQGSCVSASCRPAGPRVTCQLHCHWRTLVFSPAALR